MQTLRATVLARQGKLKQARQLLHALPTEGKQQTQRKQQAEVHLLRDAGAYAQAYALQERAASPRPGNPDITYETALLAKKLANSTPWNSCCGRHHGAPPRLPPRLQRAKVFHWPIAASNCPRHAA